MHSPRTHLLEYVTESKREVFLQILEDYDKYLLDSRQKSVLQAMEKVVHDLESRIDQALATFECDNEHDILRNAANQAGKLINERIESMGKSLEKLLDERILSMSRDLENHIKREIKFHQQMTVEAMEKVWKRKYYKKLAIENDRLKMEVNRLEIELIQHRRIARALVTIADDFHTTANTRP